MRKLLVLVASLAFLGGACGSGDDSDGDSAKETTTTTEKVDLEPKLLTISDFPAGFAADPEDEEQDPDRDRGCESLNEFGAEYDQGENPEVEANFSKETDQGVDLVVEEIELYPSTRSARTVFAAAKTAFTECTAFDATDDEGARMAGSIEAIDWEEVGDDVAAFVTELTRTEASGEPTAAEQLLLFIREGATVVRLTMTSIGATSLSPTDLRAIGQKAVAKL